jgi:hypothetical protein
MIPASYSFTLPREASSRSTRAGVPWGMCPYLSIPFVPPVPQKWNAIPLSSPATHPQAQDVVPRCFVTAFAPKTASARAQNPPEYHLFLLFLKNGTRFNVKDSCLPFGFAPLGHRCCSLLFYDSLRPQDRLAPKRTVNSICPPLMYNQIAAPVTNPALIRL